MKSVSYEKITRKYRKPMLDALAEFVAINSVYDPDTVSEENPFGIGVSKALQFIASIAEKDGFNVKNYDNKIVEILYGKGKNNLTIMAHADVVPAGTGWQNEPFAVTNIHNVLYGRGVADDKGPLLACYYALKALRDEGKLGGYQIRFLVGGNEESGSLGVEHYFHTLNKPEPTLGFSPDSDFPLIFAEKGILNFEVTKSIELKDIKSISGGVASNSVIEKCDIAVEHNIINFVSYLNKEKFEFDVNDNVVTFKGKAAHGALPELGVNAGIIALSAIAGYTNNSELKKFVKMYTPLDASGYKCDSTNEEMGHNSSNVGLLSYADNILKMTVNFRYINNCKKDELTKTIKEENAPDKVKFISDAPLLYYDKDSVLISTLMKAYQDETGDLESKPLAIGGGTYAKETKNVVAFGMQFPGWESNMHSPGESVKKKDLFKGMAIFARAIVYLGQKLSDYEN